ncbi:MAG: LuxR C-terminal-related transcriptional regulator [Nocardioidaceae bacterium]
MIDSDPLQRARQAHLRRDWAVARDDFATARDAAPLGADDLVAAGDAAWWLGRTDEALADYQTAYRLQVDQKQLPPAARVAMTVGFLSYLRGDAVGGSAWIARAGRLLSGLPECVEHGYLLSLEIDDALAEHDAERAIAAAQRVQDLAAQYDDPTLHSAGLVGEGVALVKRGSVIDGLAVIDEAMIAVREGAVAPDWAGNFYCQVMALCHELADPRRAREWTDATERWCGRFTSAAMFAGICRVHRAQLLELGGDWKRAEDEARRVCGDLADMNVAVVAEGHYQVGDIQRGRGDLAGAEDSYRRAHELGRDPQPGLALLRLAQGRPAAAAASIHAALATRSDDRLARARLRTAQAEIALATGELDLAWEAATELGQIAAAYASPGHAASARQLLGATLLANGQAADALTDLQAAGRAWHDLDAPCHAARVGLLAAEAYRALGDEDRAGLELDAAEVVFARVGAEADLQRLTHLRRSATLPDGLTPREAEVLTLIAAGLTNRDVATELVVSEKTVARHLANVFAKLGVSTRTAAAAYAFEHGLAKSSGR